MSPSFSRPAATPPQATLKARKPPSFDRRPPVIVQMEPARVIHAEPREFRQLVQLLTGKQPTSPAGDSSPETASSPVLPCSHLLIDINVAYEGDAEESRFWE